MATRGWILIELNNGTDFRYVRDETYLFTGDAEYILLGGDTRPGTPEYYIYDSDTTGGDTADTFYATGDSPGRILFDYNYISENITGDSYVTFPESDGDTSAIMRRNFDMPGDTAGLKCHTISRIRTVGVSSVRIIEEIAPKYVPIG